MQLTSKIEVTRQKNWRSWNKNRQFWSILILGWMSAEQMLPYQGRSPIFVPWFLMFGNVTGRWLIFFEMILARVHAFTALGLLGSSCCKLCWTWLCHNLLAWAYMPWVTVREVLNEHDNNLRYLICFVLWCPKTLVTLILDVAGSILILN